MEKMLLMIVSLVFAVALVGMLTVVDFEPAGGDITGNAVAGGPVFESAACGACTGDPVCAGKDGVASNYPNACAARCDGARVLYDEICEKIPRN